MSARKIGSKHDEVLALMKFPFQCDEVGNKKKKKAKYFQIVKVQLMKYTRSSDKGKGDGGGNIVSVPQNFNVNLPEVLLKLSCDSEVLGVNLRVTPIFETSQGFPVLLVHSPYFE